MRTLVERFVRGESGVTAYGLIAAALVLIGVGAWVVAPARVVDSTQINPLEMMANAKVLLPADGTRGPMRSTVPLLPGPASLGMA